MSSIDFYTLVINEAFHLAIVGVISVFIYCKYKKWWLIPLVLFFGFFIDIDHGLDYWLVTGVNLDVDKFWNMDFYCIPGAFHIFLHSPEFLVIPWLFKTLRKNGIAPAITLGMGGHLVFDMVSNGIYWYSYFFSYRAFIGFDLNQLLTHACGG
ncbi:MAG: hypothetical protein ACD_63C00179G0007 [uncultured bacterium]|nr:MAG: hypothetical protein ACD_63C00179G0007 [uncultured bacterium]